MNQAPKTANATYCATLCDQLWADGLTRAFIAPGSRSTPLALALVEHPDIDVAIFHDERSASFAALGHGVATNTPGLVLCSSGTAGAHFYAAVIEADASAVPLIVCTADRPPELLGRGAPQTIDQTHLYGTRVRAFLEPGCPDDSDPSTWRNFARSLWTAATGTTPGPVHANLSFRDPLTGTPNDLPDAMASLGTDRDQAPDGSVTTLAVDLASRIAGRRGVVIAGRNESSPADVLELAEILNWPVIADHRSGCRDPQANHAVRHFDSLLRDDNFASDHCPEIVLRLGEIVSSKATSQWISASAAGGCEFLSSMPHGRYIDPEAVATLTFPEADVVSALLDAVRDLASSKDADAVACDPSWCASWVAADAIATSAVQAVLDSTEELSEISIAQAALAAVPPGGAIMVSSSMPVRDIEWFGQHRKDITVLANRGANGIDGIVATAIGAALTGAPTLCLIGDVAFLHDATSLTALAARPIDLTIVVVDNDGGGIFSFLPQHQLLAANEYELLFGTPHSTNIADLARAHNIIVEPFASSALQPDGVRVVLTTSNRTSNLALHNAAHQAVADQLAESRRQNN